MVVRHHESWMCERSQSIRFGITTGCWIDFVASNSGLQGQI